MSSQESNIPRIASQTEEAEGGYPASPGRNSDGSISSIASFPQESTPTPAITTPRRNRKTRKGQFPKGTSGNPAGRPPGSRNKTALLMEALLDGQAEQLIQKCIERALKGDSNSMRLCIDRLVPPCKDRPIHLDLPPIDTVLQISSAMSTVVEAIGEGRITPNEGEVLANLFSMQANVLATAEFDRRITDLERGASAYKDKQAS